MARPTTLSKEWRQVLDMAGGITALCSSLGVTSSTFYRASRGLIELPEEKRNALEILCELCEIPNPLDTAPRPWSKDLTALRLLGDALARGFPAGGARAIEKLRKIYPVEQLTRLAEGEDTPEEILRAVTVLLDGG